MTGEQKRVGDSNGERGEEPESLRLADLSGAELVWEDADGNEKVVPFDD